MDHGFHHLCGSDHRPVHVLGLFDEFFLYRRQRGVADFDSQVAPGDHDGIGRFYDGRGIFQGFHPFKFRDDPCAGARVFQQRPGLLDIGSAADERDGEIIGADLNPVQQVLAVFPGQGACGQASPLQVDPLVVRQLSTRDNPAMHLRLDQVDHFQHDTPVVYKQGISGIDVLGQCPVCDTHLCLVARALRQGRVEDEFIPFM